MTYWLAKVADALELEVERLASESALADAAGKVMLGERKAAACEAVQVIARAIRRVVQR